MFGSLNRAFLMPIVVVIGLAACSGPKYYSDIPEPAARRQPSGETYRVRKGDTLYSIAFGAGRDWREVARLNGIAPPYTIYPDQIIVLSGTGREPVSTPAQPPEPPSSRPPAPKASAPQAPTAAVPAPSPSVARASAAPQKAPPPGAWTWPAAGKLIRTYSAGAQPHKGIDLTGAAGDPVYAANTGTVVYAGDGVRGYGNLLIVKHDATYLSAYAHNSRLLVKEGDVVKAGEKIAEIGDSGTDRFKLHFEVRRQGNPVDPLTVLPKR
jgi:lipoprotein NlpD